MSAATLPSEPKTIPLPCVHLFTADEYNRLTESGVFTTADQVELLDGLLVNKLAHDKYHAAALDLLEQILLTLLPNPWTFRTQRPIAMSGKSVAEPDLVIVKGPKRRFFQGHPRSNEVAIVVEVSESTLEQDHGIKHDMYAHDNIPEDWILNLVAKRVEVCTMPLAGENSTYQQIAHYGRGIKKVSGPFNSVKRN